MKSNKNYEINNDLLKCLLKIDDFCSNMPEGTDRMALWLLDEMTTEEDLDDKNEVKLQLISFGNILKNSDILLYMLYNYIHHHLYKKYHCNQHI